MLQFSPLIVFISCIPCGSKKKQRFPSNINLSLFAMETLCVSRDVGTKRRFIHFHDFRSSKWITYRPIPYFQMKRNYADLHASLLLAAAIR
jgi:hypothetical protein